MPISKQTAGKVTSWNFGKPGGWKEYLTLTDKRAKEIDILVERDDITIDALAKKVEKIESEIKFNSFVL